MSIQKRTVNVPQDIEFIVCDGPDCTHERPEKTADSAWLWIRRSFSFANTDFCSYACLARWATEQEHEHATQGAREARNL